MNGEVEKSITLLKDVITRAPNYLSNHLILAIIYGDQGRLEEARSEVAEIRRISPNYEVSHARRRLRFIDERVIDSYIEKLRSAGLP